MKRKIYEKLLDWKNCNESMPLLLLGARQVGKTYIIEEFCKNEFDDFVEVNLFQNQEIIDLYKMPISSDSKFLKLKAFLGKDIEKEGTVLFIDEIQESEELISELKYFCEKHSNIKIIVAGSLLGVKLKRSRFSFPVGKVKFLTLYPMDFEEFLMAFGEQFLIDEIRKCYKTNEQMIFALHEKALNYYRLYLCSGGMPAAVKKMIEANGDITKYNDSTLKDIISSYFADMDKYITLNTEALKIERVYRSIPSQLTNMANKFQYSKVADNAKARDYELAIDWLEASNMVEKSFLVSVPEIPLKGFAKIDSFKLYLNDVGILTNNLELRLTDILVDNISLYKGVLAENYVANQLIVNNYNLYYWNSEGRAEVDFVIYTSDGNIPIEVKASDNTKSKSLNVYMEKYNPKYAIRVSSKNFGMTNNIKSVPLYAVFCIKE